MVFMPGECMHSMLCADPEGTHDCAGNQKAAGFMSLADLEATQDPTLELSQLIRAQRSAAVPSDNNLASIV